ncbi:MAG: YhbY family RNA-binding protein [Nanoarchaeota archaeon]|nr:YhbY family RNA-binding protein [Nanoarchaeota archaeon]
MVKKSRSIVQIGKEGVTPGIMERLENDLKYRENIKIEVHGDNRNKEGVKKVREEILEKLDGNFSSRILGFTIFLKKLKSKREGLNR